MIKRIMVVYGTRPEAIKVAPLITALEGSKSLDPIVAVTGQHREMLDQVNHLFGIRPNWDLNLMVPGASLTDFSGSALSRIGKLIADDRPDAVVVQGDTSTAFIGALAAFYQKVPVIHLEAGLRTSDIRSPFPEEANRVLTARIADLHLAPTKVSADNLLNEGVAQDSVVVTGNTVIDAIKTAVQSPARFSSARLSDLVSSKAKFVLVTAHRRESWGKPMVEAMSAIRQVARTQPETQWVVPMHRNPVVREIIEEALGDVPTALLMEPLSYHEFSHTMQAAHLILTDSGGVQEEAPSLGRPVLVMRESTERPEAVAAGTARLVGTASDSIRRQLELLLTDDVSYANMARAVNPYGDGRAATRALAAIEELMGVGRRLPDFTSATEQS
ncbi:non-hydrolyzing UDP-N-acetylglucosamine 2-epimerase [Dietzia kunjamensis]|uniref:non-hydrolyzing UDP-N-acetylglucosamine 2-epimerase n=1 Tax=Dietzia kunjamensis TaxID=322509 RepID=UPI003368F0DB